MFLSVNSCYDITEDDGAVAHLKNCTNNVSPLITENIGDADVSKIADCFENKIIPFLDPSKLPYVAAALIDIILNDDHIAEDCSIGVINPLTKSDYRIQKQFVLSDLLTDFFIFQL